MRRVVNIFGTIIFLLLINFYASTSFAYPDEEKAQLDITDITAQAVQMAITSDNRYLYLGFNDVVKIIDLATFDLAATQPYDFGSDDDLSGVVGGVTLSNSRLYVSLDNGDMLSFTLDDVAAKPTAITIAEGKTLGKMAINNGKTRLYILNKTDHNAFIFEIGSQTITTVPMSFEPTVQSFNVTNIFLAPNLSGGTDYIYVTTDKGLVFYIEDGQAVSSVKVVDTNYTDNLTSVAVRSDNQYVYVVNTTQNDVHVFDPPFLVDNSVIHFTEDSEKYNSLLKDVISISVINPTSHYTFVSGLSGVSVLDSANNFIDVQGTGDNSPIPISGGRYGNMVSSGDHYIYMSNEGGFLSIITENPYVTISSITYSGGGGSMSTGDTATITFQSDVDGTYEVRVGGNIDRSGAYLIDTSGSSTGPITADTDTTFTFAYDDNSANLEEGDNTVFVFVRDDIDNYGRDAITAVVDTPPPAVTVSSVGFGNTRIYINFGRLDVSDMSHYNVYVSTNPDDVVNRSVTPVKISQPSGGSTVTAEISDLTNGDLYYVSVEAEDQGGNVGPLTYTFADGSRITGMPEQTVGPAELMGEKGCSLAKGSGDRDLRVLGLLFIFVIGSLVFVRLKCRGGALSPPKKSAVLSVSLILLLLLVPKNLHAEEATPQWWTTELKGGFWMPMNSTMKRFFEPCCNMMALVEQGFLYDSKYGFEVGVGFMSENGTAVGLTSGTPSQDRFNLFLLPVETNFTFRADFKENQVLVPYVKVGIDYVYFRENVKGHVTNGMKYGLHTVGGLQILLDLIDRGAQSTMEQDWGINDVYFTLEARYSWIDNFGGKGLDLTSLLFTFGLLFEY